VSAPRPFLMALGVALALGAGVGSAAAQAPPQVDPAFLPTDDLLGAFGPLLGPVPQWPSAFQDFASDTAAAVMTFGAQVQDAANQVADAGVGYVGGVTQPLMPAATGPTGICRGGVGVCEDFDAGPHGAGILVGQWFGDAAGERAFGSAGVAWREGPTQPEHAGAETALWEQPLWYVAGTLGMTMDSADASARTGRCCPWQPAMVSAGVASSWADEDGDGMPDPAVAPWSSAPQPGDAPDILTAIVAGAVEA